MNRNFLGNSSIKVSVLALGTMSLDVNSPREFSELVHYAYDQGINFFDTADLYDRGLNESVLGESIRSFRNDIVLATKVGNCWKSDYSGWEWNVSPAYIKSALDKSLVRLKTDYIDLYQIHGGTSEDDFQAIVDTLENLIVEGKIRSYGISSIRPNVFTKYCTESNIVSNMMQYSILDRRPESYFSMFDSHDKSILVRGVLAQGLLLNKPSRSYLDYSSDQIDEIIKQIRVFCADHSTSVEALSLAFALQHKVVASVVLGPRTLEQLKQLLTAYSQLENKKIIFDDLDLKPNFYRDHLL